MLISLLRLCLAVAFIIPIASAAQDLKWTMESSELGAPPTAVGVSPNGRYGVVAFNNRLQLHDLQLGRILSRSSMSQAISRIAFDETGNELWVGTTSGRILRSGTVDLDFSPIAGIELGQSILSIDVRGDAVAFTTASSVHVWRKNGTHILSRDNIVEGFSCALGSNAKFIAYTDGKFIRKVALPSVETTSFDLKFPGLLRIRHHATDERLVVYQAGFGLLEVTYNTGQLETKLSTAIVDDDAEFSGDGRFLFLKDYRQGVFSLTTVRCSSGAIEGEVQQFHNPFRRGASEDGGFVLVTSLSGLEVIAPPMTAVRSLWGHSNYVASVAVSDDSRLCASVSTTDAKVWDSERGRQLLWIQADNLSETGEPAFSRDASSMALPTEGGFTVYDVSSGAKLKELRQLDALKTASAQNGSQLVVCYSDSVCRLYDRTRFDSIAEIKLPFATEHVSLYANRLALTANGSIYIWDLSTNSEVRVQPYAVNVHRLEWTKDGSRLAVSGPTGTTVFDSLLTNPTSGAIGNLTLWNGSSLIGLELLVDSAVRSSTSGSPVEFEKLIALPGLPTSAGLSADGNFLLVGMYEGQVSLIKLRPSKVATKDQEVIATRAHSRNRLSLPPGAERVVLYDIFGRKLHEIDGPSGSLLDVSAYVHHPGLYILEVINGQETRLYRQIIL